MATTRHRRKKLDQGAGGILLPGDCNGSGSSGRYRVSKINDPLISVFRNSFYDDDAEYSCSVRIRFDKISTTGLRVLTCLIIARLFRDFNYRVFD